ncbi:hypothetical protein B0H19DRAFT_1256460 [Mycena capillaripes]|nr:hypothetical protein B0H19DRAFT_1256460 [Mycena capillaripes]
MSFLMRHVPAPTSPPPVTRALPFPSRRQWVLATEGSSSRNWLSVRPSRPPPLAISSLHAHPHPLIPSLTPGPRSYPLHLIVLPPPPNTTLAAPLAACIPVHDSASRSAVHWISTPLVCSSLLPVPQSHIQPLIPPPSSRPHHPFRSQSLPVPPPPRTRSAHHLRTLHIPIPRYLR